MNHFLSNRLKLTPHKAIKKEKIVDADDVDLNKAQSSTIVGSKLAGHFVQLDLVKLGGGIQEKRTVLFTNIRIDERAGLVKVSHGESLIIEAKEFWVGVAEDVARVGWDTSEEGGLITSQVSFRPPVFQQVVTEVDQHLACGGVEETGRSLQVGQGDRGGPRDKAKMKWNKTNLESTLIHKTLLYSTFLCFSYFFTRTEAILTLNM